MSLTDLKKQSLSRNKRKKISVDDFINDAENYAQGKPSVATLKAEAKPPKKAHPNFRHCTFTFDNLAIVQLQQASTQHTLPKSKLLRMLLKQFSSLDIQQQQQLLDKLQDN
ncbi:replication protein RepA [Agarivorans sp. MS3-6]|uniref:replication protein RepA n=1 Tax=Agarivorans sp. TSD2052 TaxID=2937286 RepID=UPI00200EDBE5|nr:replication protein RepA [Agarivorans sp. TSD2052]UPW18869.1 replication protein RepA [Agarivorans sp. TSD2052]